MVGRGKSYVGVHCSRGTGRTEEVGLNVGRREVVVAFDDNGVVRLGDGLSVINDLHFRRMNGE